MADPPRRPTVLVVDDSTTLLEALTAAFEDAGFDVSDAVDGEEVFRKMAAYDPDALLLDIYMPKINGTDVCRLVKGHPHWKKTFLVLMSSRLSDDEMETYKRLGADAFLKKPFDPDEAVRIVREGIGG